RRFEVAHRCDYRLHVYLALQGDALGRRGPGEELQDVLGVVLACVLVDPLDAQVESLLLALALDARLGLLPGPVDVFIRKAAGLELGWRLALSRLWLCDRLGAKPHRDG